MSPGAQTARIPLRFLLVPLVQVVVLTSCAAGTAHPSKCRGEGGAGLVQTPAQSAHCGGCHAGAQATDFVFVDAMSWLIGR